MIAQYGKRVLSFFLAMIMILSAVPVQVFAEEPHDHTEEGIVVASETGETPSEPTPSEPTPRGAPPHEAPPHGAPPPGPPPPGSPPPVSPLPVSPPPVSLLPPSLVRARA